MAWSWFRRAPLLAALLCLGSGLGHGPARAQVFQYHCGVERSKGGPTEAFLWLPPEAERARARWWWRA